jgi:general secretion pathway protein H
MAERQPRRQTGRYGPGRRPLSFGETSGFTLLELMIVLVLVTIVTGLSTVFFANSLPSAKLNATGRELSAMIRQAALLSKSRGETQVISINFDTRRYGLEGGISRNIPREIGIRVIDDALGEVSSGVYPITFHESGGIEGGTILLWSNKRRLAVSIDPILGSTVVRQ